jgi:hypothetical protein
MEEKDGDNRIVNAVVIVLGILAILTMVAFAIIAWLGSEYADV